MTITTERSTFDRHVQLMYEEAVNSIEALNRSPNPEDSMIFTNRVMVGRKIGNMIYDAPDIWTEMASVAAVQRKLNDTKWKACKEHHHSRQRGGNAIAGIIVDHFYNGTMPTQLEIHSLMEKYCQVHYTTSEENNSLAAFQKYHESEEAYRLAGITLLHALDLFTRPGRHSEEWKHQMQAKYQPLVDEALLQRTSNTLNMSLSLCTI